MLAIQRRPDEAEKCTPNLLPCKVNYDGPVDAKERFWKPEQDQGAVARLSVFTGSNGRRWETNILLPGSKATWEGSEDARRL